MPPADVVLLSVPNNMNKVVGWGAAFVTPLAPYGLMYMASALRQAGMSCKILDCYALGHGLKEAVEYVEEAKPKIVGLSIMTSQAFLACELIKQFRSRFPGMKIILGNLHADIYAEWFLSRNLADAVVHGEADQTIVELCRAYLQGDHDSLKQVNGISFSTDSGQTVQKTAQRPTLKNLDEIPLPAWDLVPYSKYRFPFYYGNPKASRPGSAQHIFTSRGCPFACTFCTVHKEMTIRYHSLPRVLEELNIIHKRLGAKYIFFMDSLFTTTPQRVTEICEGILSSGLKFDWGCEGRVSFAAKHPDMLRLMKKAGCTQIAYGVESGDQAVLDRIKKRSTVEQVEQAVLYSRDAGIEPVGLFMLGLPGDTPETMRKTIDLSKRLPFGFAQFAITTPFPGSELYYDLIREGEIDAYAWNEFSQYASLSTGMERLVYVPEGLTLPDLYAWQKAALREFYLRWQPMWRSIKNFRPHMIPEVVYSSMIMLSCVFAKRSVLLQRL